MKHIRTMTQTPKKALDTATTSSWITLISQLLTAIVTFVSAKNSITTTTTS